MQAAVLEAFGAASVMRMMELPVPSPGPGQLLLRVQAAAVNPIDWKIREGWMKERFGEAFPMVLGFDAAGVVAEAGEGVSGFKAGDQVFARSDIGPGGCYAEYALLNAATVALQPASLDATEAAAMPLAALTALNGLRDVGQVRPGSRVLINGAAGGVGIYAIQIAKIMGAQVTAVCSSVNLELVGALGADAALDYGAQDPLAAAATYDVIYDAVGSLDYAAARQRLTPDGVYITLVPAPGIDFFIPGQTQIKAQGGYFLVWSPTGADLALLAGYVSESGLHSVIDSTYALQDVAAAHERSQTERARGKIVLQVQD